MCKAQAEYSSGADNTHRRLKSRQRAPAHQLGALDLTIYEVANVVGVVKGQGDLATRICRAILKRSGGRVARVDAGLGYRSAIVRVTFPRP